MIRKHSPELEKHERIFSEMLTKIHEIGVMLNEQPSLEQLYLEVVRQALLQLPFDRMGLILFDAQTGEMQGTWGTDAEGQLKDEHDYRAFLTHDKSFEFIQTTLTQKYLVAINDNVPLLYYGEQVGVGWSAMVGLWHGDEVIGWLAADNLLSGQPLGLFEQDLLGVYGQKVAQSLIQKRHELALEQMNAQLEQRVASRTQALHEKMSELKSAQELLVHSEKMASLGFMSAGIAHEINNPIGYIRANLTTLGEYGAQLADELLPHLAHLPEAKQREIKGLLEDLQPLIGESVQGCQRVQDIVSGLKLFARGHQDECHHTDLNEVVKQTLMLTDNQLKGRCDVSSELEPIGAVLCNAGKMVQVMTNLILNAAQACSAQQGRIHIETWQESGEVNLAVSDNGCGIDSDIADQIFMPFFTTKAVGEGTGLGLSISYGIVKEFNGRIQLMPNRHFKSGARFVLSFPASHS